MSGCRAHSGPGGDGTTGLTSSPGGTTHTFLWNSYSDIGDANDSNVIIRITAATGSAVSTAPFTVLDASQTSATWVTTPTSPQTGNVSISYILTNAGWFDCSVQVQYSPNGGVAWYAATPGSGGDGMAGLASSTGGTTHTFVWDSTSDIVGARELEHKDPHNADRLRWRGEFVYDRQLHSRQQFGERAAGRDSDHAIRDVKWFRSDNLCPYGCGAGDV